jgi:mRNA-degrading endonuclease RelE of RelBE toxin-antitoxin system
VRIEWSPAACAGARRYMADQDGMREIARAVTALADDPSPAAAFIRGGYRRLKVGPYRVMYILEGDLITIERVDIAS